VGVATDVAQASAVNTGGHVWGRIASDYRIFSAYSDEQREHAVLDEIPLPSDVFDFYRAYTERGDRVYFQVLQSGFGSWADLPTVVRTAGRWYLLPAVETRDLDDATVVVSFHADPADLPVTYLTQVEAGLQPISVSRFRAP
jgi:hypothetical protein